MRPLIVKARYFLPGPSRHEAARACLKYIADPGRDDLARWDEALRQEDVASEATVYAMHIHKRPGSQGLFGPSLTRRVKEAEIDAVFGRHTGAVWSLIVSVNADDAAANLPHLMGRAAWEDACRLAMPRTAEAMGIPLANLRWVAAMHRRPSDGGPHVHILFWSADPGDGERNVRGAKHFGITPTALRRIKGAWTSTLYGPVREAIGAEKDALRNEIRSLGVRLLGRRSSQTLGAELAEVAAALPGHGRLAYAYMPPETKAAVDRVIDTILALPELTSLVERHARLAGEMASHYSTDPSRHEAARRNATEDLRRRLAGEVLRAAAGLDERLAWEAVTADLWAAARGKGDCPGAVAAVFRRAIGAVASGRSDPQAAARDVIDDPALAGHVAALKAAAARRGDPGEAEARVERVERRLEAVLAERVRRAAEYVREARGWWAAMAAARVMAAVSATIRQLERDAALAAAEEMEQEAARIRRQA